MGSNITLSHKNTSHHEKEKATKVNWCLCERSSILVSLTVMITHEVWISIKATSIVQTIPKLKAEMVDHIYESGREWHGTSHVRTKAIMWNSGTTT